ncbi:protein OBERON 3-like isoform X1 [Solanum stenotomum]|uniref:protein OBERON 3-like isoform X1 n=1 Tax=Solanum stenotomum TaxID=172797 RepID=UPI0020D04F6F|nr:protein OBERON 3-like isoform X1 [Solanum stenotomum]
MNKNMDSIDENRFGKFQEKGVHFLEESASQMKMDCNKGKEIVVFEDQNDENNIWVDRDFLKLNEYKGNSSKRVAENEEIQVEIREKKLKGGILDLSSKRVAQNEEILVENRGKKLNDGILDLSSKRVAENEEILAEISEKKLKGGILNLSSKGVAENEEILVEISEKKLKGGIFDLSSKRVAENEEILAEFIGKKAKDGILDLSSKGVLENEEILAEITDMKAKDGILDLSSEGVLENEEILAEITDKKAKDGILDLSLALPTTSSSRSLQSPEPSNNNTRIGYFRNGSLSSCYSHPFSHNLSYSLTLSSEDDSEYSGEGINWSGFSQFRKVEAGDCTLPGHPDGSRLALSCKKVNKEICDNDTDRISSSDSNSFFLFELPARPVIDDQSGDSRILGEVVSESVPLMAQIMQELPDETVESTKEYLRSLIAIPENKDLLVSLQKRLNGRSDLTFETLSKCNKTQLEILVAIKMGLGTFLSSENHLQTTELIQIFSLERCRNIYCKRLLPVDNCKCKICSKNKGFCNVCLCQVCLNLDYANGTCSWVGCDLCVHWCHVVCALQRNLIKPGPSINGPSGTTEMQFHCLGCSHSSEMFRFAKEMYRCCAKNWDQEILIKELDYVQKIFHGSDDFKGKELHAITYGLRNKLEKKMISPSDACNFIFQFFKYTDGLSHFLSSSFPASIPLADKSSFYIMSSSSRRKATITVDHHRQSDAKDLSKSDKMIEDECSVIKEV